jgi:hypothetical protein
MVTFRFAKSAAAALILGQVKTGGTGIILGNRTCPWIAGKQVL